MRWLSLCLLLCGLWVGCNGTSSDGSSRAAEAGALRSVELSELDDFPSSVREQLEARHARVLEVRDRPDPDASVLAEAYGGLGQLLLAYDLDHLAEPALLNASDLQPQDHRWHYYLGHLYSEAGRLEAAAREFEAAASARAEYAPARIHLAKTYRELGRGADAEEILEGLLRDESEPAVAHLLLGHLAAEDDPKGAIQHYESVLELQPQASIVRHPLGRAYRELGNLERSQEHLAQRGRRPVLFSDPLIERLKEIRRGAGASIYAGNKLLEQGRYEEAAALFEQAAVEDSTRVSAFLNLAGAVAQIGDLERATEALERVLTLDPSNSRAHYNLGLLAVLSGAPDRASRAREHFNAAVAADPSLVEARLALANLLWRDRQCDSAIAHFDHYLEARAADVVARMKAAICHAHLEDYDRALELLEDGYQAFPGHPLLQGALVRILAASSDPNVRDGQRAVQLAEQLATDHRGPETMESLAMAYAEVGRYEEAVRAQNEVIRFAQARDIAPQMLGYLEANLSRYERGLPCRAPWPPTVFDQ